MEGITNIAKTVSAKQDEDVWLQSVLDIMSTIKIRAITIITAIKIRMNGSNSFLKK